MGKHCCIVIKEKRKCCPKPPQPNPVCQRNINTFINNIANFNLGAAGLPAFLATLAPNVVTTYYASSDTSIPFAGTFNGPNGFIQFAATLASVSQFGTFQIQSISTNADCSQVSFILLLTGPLQARCSPNGTFVTLPEAPIPQVITQTYNAAGQVTQIQIFNPQNDLFERFYSACPPV
jgi:hypothetical protein